LYELQTAQNLDTPLIIHFSKRLFHGVDKRIRIVLKEWDGRAWAGFIWLWLVALVNMVPKLKSSIKCEELCD
jgi:hypothetical protein